MQLHLRKRLCYCEFDLLKSKKNMKWKDLGKLYYRAQITTPHQLEDIYGHVLLSETIQSLWWNQLTVYPESKSPFVHCPWQRNQGHSSEGQRGNLPSTIMPSRCCSSGCPEKATATKNILLDTKVVAISPCLTDTSLTEIMGKRAKIPG